MKKPSLSNAKNRFTKLAADHPKTTAYLAGIIYYAWQMSWLKGNEVANQFSNPLIAKFVAYSALFQTILFFSLAPVLFVYLFKKINLKLANKKTILLASALWVVCEASRSILFSVYSAGPGATIGNYWHFGNIGLWLICTPLVYLSRFGGLFLLTYVMGTIIFSVLFAIKTKNYLPLAAVLIISGLLSFASFKLYAAANGKDLKVGAISQLAEPGNYAPNSHGLNAVQKLPSKQQDIVVLPEYSRFWEYDNSRETNTMKNALKNDNGLVVHSIQDKQDNKTYNAVAFSAPDGNILDSETKSFLIPGGEFVPYVYRAILRVSGQTRLLNDFENRRAISPAARPERPYVWQSTSIGALACSAANAPELYRTLVNQDAEILVNTASLGTLGVNKSYHDKSLNLAKLHSISNARPFVQSARGGYVFVLDLNGKVLAINKDKTDNAISTNVTTNNRKTVYSLTGDWPIYMSLVSLAIMKVIYKWRRRP